MPYILGRKRTKENALPLRLFCDNDGNQVGEPDEVGPDNPLPAAMRKRQESGESVHEFGFWLQPLKGKDSREINDTALEGTRRGRARFHTGTTMRKRIVRSVVGCWGIEDDHGNEVGNMTNATYDETEEWILNALHEKVLAIAQESDEEQGE